MPGLTGLPGSPGSIGLRGARGATGPPGVDGVDGLSAFTFCKSANGLSDAALQFIVENSGIFCVLTNSFVHDSSIYTCSCINVHGCTDTCDAMSCDENGSSCELSVFSVNF